MLCKVTRYRSSLDMDRLEEFLQQNGSDITEYQKKSSFSFLDVRVIKEPAKALAA